MKNKIELLAPGGDIDSIKAAIVAGADAIYCGLNKFNARNRAKNLNFDDLNGVLNLAHGNNCKIFLTLNIIIVESEIPSLINLLNKLINTRIDGVIVQDLGLLYLLSEYFKGLKIHASTQLTTHNEGQIFFLSKLNATQVNLSRELNIHEIESLTLIGHQNKILTEVFVHGSYCISFSGICYMSSVLGGKSGNRGRCSQPCRDRYLTTPEGKNFPLNLKDNSAYFDLRELSDAGVDSLKIEGRIKKLDYVYTVVNAWKNQIRSFYNTDRLIDGNSDLYKVFNRDFSNSYLKGDIHKQMFIDNPRDNSIQHLSETNHYCSNDQKLKDQIKLYEEKEKITSHVKNQIRQLSIAKSPITISISGKVHTPLKVSVKTPGTSFIVLSEIHLVNAKTTTPNRHNGNPKGGVKATAPDSNDPAAKRKKYTAQSLDYKILFKRLKSLNNTEYYIKDLELENLQSDLFIPFKELTSIKKRISFILNGSKKMIEPVDVPSLKKQGILNAKPDLAVLISSQKDLYICKETTSQIFFEIPNCFENICFEFVNLFSKNESLIPWFPSILMGKHYKASVAFLQQVQPKFIVTNNTGIAYEACKEGIPWIAGPYLNIVNSFSLLCLKEKFNCYGSFISNEISKNQIKTIKSPDNFKLYYSIYHPILLMTSRQCLLHQVIGCEKDSVNEECISKCHKSSSIKNLKKVSLYIEKSKRNYHCIYNNHNFLNPNIMSDLPDIFSYFFIDLRDKKTETKIRMDKVRIIALFENLLNGNPNSKKELKQMIHPTTITQYEKGI
jgi:U32 family peptidase